MFGKFSPDGKWIAFTGQYDGDEQVYVIPSGGGVPRQLTFYPAKGPLTPRWGWDNQVYGWTSDGKRIVFRSQRDSWALADRAALLGFSRRWPSRSAADADSRFGRFFARRRRRLFIRRSRATSDLRNVTAAVRRTALHLRSEELRHEADH